MGTFTGKCRYCGEEINIIAENQSDADRQASRDCRCGEKIKVTRSMKYEQGENI